METNQTELLTEPVGNLQLSDRSKDYLVGLKVENLNDFISRGWSYYTHIPNPQPIRFNEIIALLVKNDLLYLMEGK